MANRQAGPYAVQHRMSQTDSTHALFRSEYDLELEAWLRRRFRSVCVCYLALNIVVLASRLISFINSDEVNLWPGLLITLGTSLLSIAIIGYYLFGRKWQHATRPILLKAAFILILLLGIVSMIKSVVMANVAPAFQTDFIVPLFF